MILKIQKMRKDNSMRVLSLFSGGGLGDYGLTLAGMEIVGQVEWDKYCQKILKLRWPEVPKWEDVRNVTGDQVREKCGPVDIIAGGFPCQPFSVAGKKKGKDDERNMWPAMYRIISEVKPPWVLAENVRGIVKPYLDTVLADLEGLGYTCLPLLVPASALGAPHRRERLWVIAYSESIRTQRRLQQQGRLSVPRTDGENRRDSDVADSACEQSSSNDNRRKQRKISGQEEVESGRRRSSDELWGSQWAVEPAVGRVANGIANRVDRLKLLGNGQVVQVVRWLGEMIIAFESGFY
jgi:DNA (cytosine-5)-methyltransferase 1